VVGILLVLYCTFTSYMLGLQTSSGGGRGITSKYRNEIMRRHKAQRSFDSYAQAILQKNKQRTSKLQLVTVIQECYIAEEIWRYVVSHIEMKPPLKW